MKPIDELIELLKENPWSAELPDGWKVIEDGDRGPVMDKLAALIEEGSVVFVGLDHEFPARTNPRGDAEILGYAADQEAGLTACRLQQVGNDSCSRGLAVGAGDRDHFAARQHMVAQPFGAAGVGASIVQHRFHRRIAARERIADDDGLDIRTDMRRVVALIQGDAEVFQLGGHRRIDGLIAAFNLMAKLTRQSSDAAHERAGDTEDMEFHACRYFLLRAVRLRSQVAPRYSLGCERRRTARAVIYLSRPLGPA